MEYKDCYGKDIHEGDQIVWATRDGNVGVMKKGVVVALAQGLYNEEIVAALKIKNENDKIITFKMLKNCAVIRDHANTLKVHEIYNFANDCVNPKAIASTTFTSVAELANRGVNKTGVYRQRKMF